MVKRVGSRLVLEAWAVMLTEVSRYYALLASSIELLPSGYAQLIRTYVAFILAKLRFHRQRPEFNGLFEYEEYISLKGIDDPNEGYVQFLVL